MDRQTRKPVAPDAVRRLRHVTPARHLGNEHRPSESRWAAGWDDASLHWQVARRTNHQGNAAQFTDHTSTTFRSRSGVGHIDSMMIEGANAECLPGRSPRTTTSETFGWHAEGWIQSLPDGQVGWGRPAAKPVQFAESAGCVGQRRPRRQGSQR
jgi:hypothetical protein